MNASTSQRRTSPTHWLTRRHDLRTIEGWDALRDSWTDPVEEFVGGAGDGTKDLAGDGWSEVKSWL